MFIYKVIFVRINVLLSTFVFSSALQLFSPVLCFFVESNIFLCFYTLLRFYTLFVAKYYLGYRFNYPTYYVHIATDLVIFSNVIVIRSTKYDKLTNTAVSGIATTITSFYSFLNISRSYSTSSGGIKNIPRLPTLSNREKKESIRPKIQILKDIEQKLSCYKVKSYILSLYLYHVKKQLIIYQSGSSGDRHSEMVENNFNRLEMWVIK